MNTYQTVCASTDPEATIAALSDRDLTLLLDGIPGVSTGIPALVDALATAEAAQRYQRQQLRQQRTYSHVNKPLPNA